ncbi:GumC family protein [Sphingomonas desiccabilis]|uniref:non-specific protein-tyrosine kinase n=1 Tax=Sphingomonas desiccabilis TaxID=429134 RepID=A0A4Q2IZN6_9SPHN|nr:polysaccharide biosynthesis tyrosine autokinase [Sphingomonas desiccabilis]MBB3912719.1 capsular exopolysaccharide synthesis family protein [Sphingomonas desiccabilis]RXZ34681.1 polysaccharide biosynthesis tyrosine autokinase [Sphingomonas desiccabilis]
MRTAISSRSEALRTDRLLPDDEADDVESFNIDLGWIFAILRRNLLLIAAVVVAALVLGLVVTMLMTPRYTAASSVQVEQQADRVLGTEDVQPVASIQETARFLQTQTDLLTSRAMADRVARRLNLYRDTDFLEAMDASPADPVAGATPADVQRQRRNAVLGQIAENLSVRLPNNSRIIEIAFTSPASDVAAGVANAFAEEFITSNLSRRYNSSAYAREFLSQQLAEAKQRLEQSERKLNSYARQANLIDTGAPNAEGNGGTSVTTSSLVQLNQAANQARAQRILAEEKWRSASTAPALSIPEVVSNSAVQQLLARRAEISARLSDERARHLEGHPNVQQLAAQRDDITRELDTLSSGIRRSIRDAYESARRQEEALQAQVRDFSAARLAEQDRSVEYRILQREADTNRSLYDGLLQRFREVSAAAGVSTNNISIVDAAEPPANPSSPRLMLNLALALLVGLAAAGLAVFIREQFDDSVRLPDDLPVKLGVTPLGVTPNLKDVSPAEALADPRSSLTEAYSALRIALQYSTSQGLPQTLLVTSSQAGEGKSTTSYAIAVGMAKVGLRVLLVDVDLRRPIMHRLFGMANESGLTSLLTGQSEVEAQIRHTNVDGLDFLSSGPISPNPTDLLGTGRLAEAVAAMRQGYDLIVFDGPPVLGLADAPILAGLLDATMLVVEANRKRHGAGKNSLRRLRAVHANILGALLTKFDPGKAGLNANYGYYAEYYQYGSRAGNDAG